eukprot:NODE_12379_length_399_cov_4.934783_g11721_i0.p1 GENE.NODE_12379_length_399_cov_4.934783_g11721_i0~~NODE_12379_length_399_cov_4.934783_g11721_i0.p1  ORF type:complete len:120 (+),score=11.03 NODE_12379_length_399_cov_4.934783_g11721_i0:46-360(+)
MDLTQALGSIQAIPFSNLQEQDITPIVNILTSKTKDSDIQALVNGLNPDLVDVLMKAIYKGLESGRNSSSLFKWHSIVEESGGPGSIVRVLTDKPPIEGTFDED